MTQTVRELPADVYDALELSAEAFGGIGQPDLFEDEDRNCPMCIYGHAEQATDTHWLGASNPIVDALDAVKIAGTIVSQSVWRGSDQAVQRINERLDRPQGSRVTFKQWCRELNVVRGK